MFVYTYGYLRITLVNQMKIFKFSAHTFSPIVLGKKKFWPSLNGTYGKRCGLQWSPTEKYLVSHNVLNAIRRRWRDNYLLGRGPGAEAFWRYRPFRWSISLFFALHEPSPAALRREPHRVVEWATSRTVPAPGSRLPAGSRSVIINNNIIPSVSRG